MKRKKSGWIVKLCLAAFIIYTAYKLVNLQMEIHGKRAEIADYKVKIEEQQRQNENLQQDIDHKLTEDEIKQIARDKLGLATPDERIFVNVTGQ
ncbi:MAG: septum formation initiator family protein [Bacillota bacterium]|nr:septum formation initiator family protein [Bacillota bacterium]